MDEEGLFTHEARWSGRPTAGDIGALPGKPAVFLMEDAGGAAVQLMVSQSLRRSLQSRLIDAAEAGGRADLGEIVRGVRWRPVGSAFEGRWWHWRAARRFYPREYRSQLAFGPSYYLFLAQSSAVRTDHVNLAGPPAGRGPMSEPDSSEVHSANPGLSNDDGRDEGRPLHEKRSAATDSAQFTNPPQVGTEVEQFARSRAVHEIRVTEHIWREPGAYIGPWPTRGAAQAALESLWDLFDLCRYPEQIRKAPRGVRCAYADMGRCDAPCDGTVPMERHEERLAAAWRFAGEGPARVLEELRARMKEAAVELRFEVAAQVREQQKSAERWHTHGAIRPIRESEMRVFLAVASAGRRRFRCFWFDRGTLIAGPEARGVELSAAAAAWLKATFAGGGAAQVESARRECVAERRSEQTWLVHHFLGHDDARSAVVIGSEAGVFKDELSGAWAVEEFRAEIDRQLERIRSTSARPASESSVVKGERDGAE